jgi:hypothetical protein
LIAAVAAAGIWVAQRNDGSAVLGTKVTRCKTADGTAVSGGSRLTAENAPLTVTVSGGRVTSVLAPAFKVEPGTQPDPLPASFTIARPEAAGGKLIAAVTIRNLTDCPTHLSGAQAVTKRGAAAAVSSPIRFGTSERALVSPGQHMTGSFSVPIDGDGTYEISAWTDAEIGLVR